MTSELVLVTESSCHGIRLTSRERCRTVMMIMWRSTLDVDDQLENTVLNIYLLMCTLLTTACVLSSTLTALVLAMGFKAIIQHFLLMVIEIKFYFHTCLYTIMLLSIPV